MQGQAVEHCGAVALQTGREGVQVRQVVSADLADPVVETVAVETGPADGWSGGPGPCRRHGGVITRNRRHQHRDRVRLRFRHQTQQRAPTRRQTQHLGQARARPSCDASPIASNMARNTGLPHGMAPSGPGPVPRRSGRRTSSLSQNSRRLEAESAFGGHRSPHHPATARIDCAPARPDNCTLDTPTAPAPTWPRRMTRLPHVRSAPRRHRKSRVRVFVPPWPGIAVAQLRWWCTVSAASCACSLTS
jgi:hypothetical protein